MGEGEDARLSDRLFVVHEPMGMAVAGLAAVHIGAALYHQFVRKDGIINSYARTACSCA